MSNRSLKGIVKSKVKNIKNGKENQRGILEIKKGGSFVAYVDEDCIGKDTLKSEQKNILDKVKWILIRKDVWDEYKKDYPSLQERSKNLLGTDHIKLYKTGRTINISLDDFSTSRGQILVLIPYIYYPEYYWKGQAIRCVLLEEKKIDWVNVDSPPKIKYSNFYKPLHVYGQAVQVKMRTHLFPHPDSNEIINFKFTVYSENNKEVHTVEKEIKSKVGEYNIYTKFPITIDPSWKKKSMHQPNQTMKYYIKVTSSFGTATIHTPNFIYPEYDSQEYLPYLYFDKEQNEWIESETRGYIEVFYKKQTEILRDWEKAKTAQIQSIGDVKYNKKEFDPCGYSKIIIKEKENTKRDPLVIFDEKDKDTENFIDNTQQGFDIVAGDKTKNVVIITVEGLHNGSAYACSGVMLPKGKMHDTWEDVFQMENAYAVKRHQENWVKNSRKTYNDKYLSIKKKKDNIQTQYGKSRFSPHPYTVYDKEEDPTHQDQLKKTGTAINNENKHDTDVVLKSDKEYTPNTKQGLIKGENYEKVGDNGLELSLNYHYNKTFLEGTAVSSELTDTLWLFNYFWLSKDLAQQYFVPISTCRYPNQIARVNVYPDIKWNLVLEVGSTEAYDYSHTNMSYESGQFKKHQEKSIKTGQARRWLNQAFYFSVSLKATTGNIEKQLGVKYEDKIETILKVFTAIKDVLDSISGVKKINKARAAKAVTKKVGGKFLPVTFQIDYPAINLSGNWELAPNYKKEKNYQITTTGLLKFGFSPLIKGTGKLDLITCSEYIPEAGPVIAGLRMQLSLYGIDPFLNLYAFGQIDLNGEIHLNKEDIANIDCKTTVGLGVELGVLVAQSVPNIKFTTTDGKKDVTKKDDDDLFSVEAEVSGKGETSVIFDAKRGVSRKGVFFELSAGFGGLDVYLTAKAKVQAGSWSTNTGFQDKPFKILKPQPEILKGRHYIIKS